VRQGLDDRGGRGQPGQRIGDRVPDEDRSVGAQPDQSARHRRVVAERHPVPASVLAAVTCDGQPDPARFGRAIVRSESPPRQGRRPGTLDHHVGDGEQIPQRIPTGIQID
jgi:hypothetical protein